MRMHLRYSKLRDPIGHVRGVGDVAIFLIDVIKAGFMWRVRAISTAVARHQNVEARLHCIHDGRPDTTGRSRARYHYGIDPPR